MNGEREDTSSASDAATQADFDASIDGSNAGPDEGANDDKTQRSAPSVVLAVIEVVSIGLCLAAFAGQLPPDVNESHYLTKAKHFWDPDFCPGDIFLGSAFSHWLFYWSTGWLTQFVSLSVYAWIGRIATWILFSIAWWRINRAVNPRFGISILTIALFLMLNDRFHLAGEWVVGGFEAKGIAYSFILLGLDQVLRHRWIRVWPLLGIASAFHVVVGGWAVLACGFAYILTEWIPIHRSDRLRMGQQQRIVDRDSDHPSPVGGSQTLALAIGFGIALFGILPPLISEWDTPTRIARQAHFFHVHHRIRHHLMFSDFATLHIARFSFLIVAWAGFLAFFWNQFRLRKLHLFCAASLVISFGGLVLSGIAEPADGTGADGLEWPNLATSLLRYYWFRIADFALPLGIALSVNAAVSRSFAASHFSRLHQFGACLIGLLIMVAFGVLVTQRYENLRPLADRNSLPFYRDDTVRTQQTYQNWVKACEWIRDNTPEDSVFITPVEQQTFKWYAQRNEVASWKDTPQDANSVIIWRDRLNRVYFPQKQFENGMFALSDEQLVDLSREFRVNYLMVPQSHTDDLTDQTLLKQVYPPVKSAKSTYVIFEFPSRSER